MGDPLAHHGERVASAVLQQFASLRPRGKPQGREWTVLAGLVVEDTTCSPGSPEALRVMTLATGNKCVGKAKIPLDGSIVHDSHAEVLTRRALMLRLWRELYFLVPTGTAGASQSGMPLAVDVSTSPSSSSSAGAPAWAPSQEYLSQSHAATGRALMSQSPGHDDNAGCHRVGIDHSRFLLEPNGRGAWRLKPWLRLHLYISDPPCGDASIYEQAHRQLHACVPPSPSSSACDYEGCSAKESTRPGARGFVMEDALSEEVKVPASPAPIEGIRTPTSEDGQAVREGRDVLNGQHRQLPKNSCFKRDGEGGSPSHVYKKSRCIDNGTGSPRDTPCLPFQEERRSGTGGANRMTFTGAKPALVEEGDLGIPREHSTRSVGSEPEGDVVLSIQREQEQALGVLRIKSSRSNISEEGRTLSMSCSDKLAKWAVLGLQGGLLASWVEPLFMSSIVLSADPYTEGPAPLIEALRRAVPERAARARAALKQAGTLYPEPPTVEVFVTSSVVFERCKMQAEQRALSNELRASDRCDHGPLQDSSSRHVPANRDGRDGGKTRRRRPGAVPSGTAINWVRSHGKTRKAPQGQGGGTAGAGSDSVETEVTLSATGRMHGAVSRGILHLRMRSRLCRARLLEVAEEVARLHPPRSPPHGNSHISQRVQQQPQRQDEDVHSRSVPAKEAAIDSAGGAEGTRGASSDSPKLNGTVSGESDARAASGFADGEAGDELRRGPVGQHQRPSYWRLKQANRNYSAARTALLSTPTFRGWLVGRRQPQEFAVDEKNGVVPLATIR